MASLAATHSQTVHVFQDTFLWAHVVSVHEARTKSAVEIKRAHCAHPAPSQVQEEPLVKAHAHPALNILHLFLGQQAAGNVCASLDTQDF